MRGCPEKKKKLIEEIGVLFEQTHDLTPLAARINVIMILSPNEGHTFEEIVQITGASKSSVSTQLNLLLKLNRAEYFTKTGERRRYFRASKQYVKMRLQDHLQKIQKELELFEELTQYNKENNPEKFQKNKDFTNHYGNYLRAQKKNLETAIAKMPGN
ncbi:transcriptional regulator [Christiangramia fulva]|uniref:Transcriptional regulator n=2 Tax=Christiangramia fulva TaxID=2126553 RepID=A0A2R3Z341_9FLAO|nr:transcriptional regulator [Christiangramia fulva]